MIGAYIPRGLRTDSTIPLLPREREEARQTLKYVSVIIGVLSIAIIFISLKCIKNGECTKNEDDILIE